MEMPGDDFQKSGEKQEELKRKLAGSDKVIESNMFIHPPLLIAGSRSSSTPLCIFV
jgi:hypothetical protein